MKILKHLVCALICMTLVFSLTGCEEPTKEIGKSTDTTVSTPQTGPKEEVFYLNETAVFENLKITAAELKESNGKSFMEAEEGKIFVGIKFIIENISEEEQVVSSLLLFDAYANDVNCDFSLSAAAAFDNTVDGTIAPGKKLVGWYAVELPEDWEKLELDVQADILSKTKARFVFTK